MDDTTVQAILGLGLLAAAAGLLVLWLTLRKVRDELAGLSVAVAALRRDHPPRLASHHDSPALRIAAAGHATDSALESVRALRIPPTGPEPQIGTARVHLELAQTQLVEAHRLVASARYADTADTADTTLEPDHPKART